MTALQKAIQLSDAGCHESLDFDDLVAFGAEPEVTARVSMAFYGAPGVDPLEPPSRAFERWRSVTRPLVRASRATEPWLYAWAVFGVLLCQRVRHREPARWAQLVEVARRAGCEAPAALPYSIAEAMALFGDDVRLAEVEAELLAALGVVS